METKRLKNIAILILLLLNAFLLVLLVYQEMQGESARQGAMEELKTLFATEKLTLAEDGVFEDEVLPLLVLTRKTASETEIAAFLLGETAAAQNEGGGIVSYSSDEGTVRFRSGGGFDTVQFKRAVGDAGDFMRKFCDRFGYGNITGEVVIGNGSLTAIQYAANVPIYGCTLTLVFEEGYLVSAAGAHIDLDDAQTDSEKTLDGISSMLRFFDYRREYGAICSEVRSIRCVYQLNNTVGSTRLMPVWVVETDTYSYQVDAVSGEVSRK